MIEKVELVVAKTFFLLKQLNFRLGIHICNHIMEILELSAANFGKRNRKLFQRSRQELQRVAKYHVLFPLDLKKL